MCLRARAWHCVAIACVLMGNPERLCNVTVRLPCHITERAERIARSISTALHDVTPSEVMRRAMVIGLEAIAKEYAIHD